jgi:hypothetical protein
MNNEINLALVAIVACIGGLAMFEFIRWRIATMPRKCRCKGAAKPLQQVVPALEIPETPATIEPQYDIHKQNWILVKRLPGTVEKQRVGEDVFTNVLDAVYKAEELAAAKNSSNQLIG